MSLKIYIFSRINEKREYLPILHVDHLSIKDDEYKVILGLFISLNYLIIKKNYNQASER